MINGFFLILLIPLVFFQIFLFRLGSSNQSSKGYNLWQGDFLITASLWGGLLVAITEGLSFFYAINRVWLAIAWSIVLIVVFVIDRRTGKIKLGWKRIKEGFHPQSKFEIVLLMLMVCIAAIVFLVAVVSPSNNVDSMRYHLPRVLHWAQNQSLRHYPIARIAQNIRPYWAEAVMLHLRVLSGNDRFVNLVQWFYWCASIIGVTGIVSLFGGSRRTKWLSAAFVISIPMGILQSSTAQNDIVSAFWVICLTYFIILSMKRSLYRIEFISLALALGVGMLVKATFFPYAALLMVWFLSRRLMNVGFKQVVIEGMTILIVITLLNVAFWTRNVISYGGLYGNAIPVYFPVSDDGAQEDEASHQIDRGSEAQTEHAEVACLSRTRCNKIAYWQQINIESEPSGNPQALETDTLSFLDQLRIGFVVWATKVAQMIAMNFVSPIYWLNQRLFQLLGLLPGIFPAGFIGSLQNVAWNHEDVAGSPIHISLILISLIYWGVKDIKGKEKLFLKYSLVTLIGFSLVALIGHSTNIYSIRYQLAFLVMGAPLFAITLKALNKRVLQILVMVGFLLYALPYVLISNIRPVIDMPPWPTRVGSIFTTDPTWFLFAMTPDFLDIYEYVTMRSKRQTVVLLDYGSITMIWNMLSGGFYKRLKVEFNSDLSMLRANYRGTSRLITRPVPSYALSARARAHSVEYRC